MNRLVVWVCAAASVGCLVLMLLPVWADMGWVGATVRFLLAAWTVAFTLVARNAGRELGTGSQSRT